MGFEFLAAAEQLGATGAALVDALGRGVGVLAGERPLGAGAAQDCVFVGRELLAPFVVGQLQLGGWGRHASTLAMFSVTHPLLGVGELSHAGVTKRGSSGIFGIHAPVPKRSLALANIGGVVIS